MSMVSEDTTDCVATEQLLTCPFLLPPCARGGSPRSTYLLSLLTRLIRDSDIVNRLKSGNEISKD